MALDIKQFKKPLIIKSLAIALASAAVIVLCFIQASSLWKKNKGLSAQIERKSQDIAKGSTTPATVDKLAAETKGLGLKVAEEEKNFFTDTEEIFLQLNKFAEAYKISLNAIEPLEKARTIVSEKADLYLMPVDITMKCDYFQLVDFLEKIENARKLMLIEEVKIQGNSQDIWNHDIDLRIKVPIFISAKKILLRNEK